MSDRTYEFVQLDVFTQTPLTGNPLAVFPDARGLNDESRVSLEIASRWVDLEQCDAQEGSRY